MTGCGADPRWAARSQPVASSRWARARRRDPTSRRIARQLAQTSCRTPVASDLPFSGVTGGTKVADTAAQTTGAEHGLRRHHSQLGGGTIPMTHRMNAMIAGKTLVGLTLAAAFATAGLGCGDSGGNSPTGKGGNSGTAGTTGTAGSMAGTGGSATGGTGGTGGTGTGGSIGTGTAGTGGTAATGT